MAVLDRFRSFWTKLFPGTSAERGAPESSVRDAGADPQGLGSFDDFAEGLKDSLNEEIDLELGPSIADAAPSEFIGEDGGPQELFAGIAANYAQPIKDFIFELARGTATRHWVEICMPVLDSLIHGAQSLELDGVVQRMVSFRDALAQTESSDGSTFDRASRKLILERFEALAEAMPTTFDLGIDTRRRESIIIHSLLRQIPGVGHVTFEKLYGAGLTSLDVLFMANPTDMSTTTGIPVSQCELICRKINDHRAQLEDGTVDGSKPTTNSRLVELVQTLKQHHAKLQQVADENRTTGGAAEEKRACLRRRLDCTLQIDVLLAEMGEVDLVEELRKLGVEKRIERLEQHLGGTVPEPETKTVFNATRGNVNDPQGIR